MAQVTQGHTGSGQIQGHSQHRGPANNKPAVKNITFPSVLLSVRESEREYEHDREAHKHTSLKAVGNRVVCLLSFRMHEQHLYRKQFEMTCFGKQHSSALLVNLSAA